jgi:hypothetical protein
MDLSCEVVSSNVASDFSTTRMGMGVRFRALSDDQRAWLTALRGLVALEDEFSPDAESHDA